ncbi:dienelactone hydrolase family protein [Deefgea piscis]|uniref:Dienelactone hydrolase family protein n=1 Tax=Deefgea piscis TaxID=2739061 RepID=A0A6M8SK18_9NEIS|nr:dienelactone hydrolase family protein [Deefgea piscis]QKJ65422.1 dienelactone hydrolase family protein [Deefgea piscis]
MKIVLSFFLLLVSVSTAAEEVVINSGKVSLAGFFLAPPKPMGPAILLLHGCNRLDQNQASNHERLMKMASLLQEMNFGILMLDEDGPKGKRQGCFSSRNKRKNTGLRANDAQIAIAWLKARNEVDASRIAVIGWSDGASTVLALMNRREPGVKSAVAFYPNCQMFLGRSPYRVAAPTLLLVGEEGKKSTAESCRRLGEKSGQDLFHQVSYPDAEHDFADAEVFKNKAQMNKLVDRRANPNSFAAQDAWRRSFKWISRWFDPERSIQGIPPSTLP